MLGPPDGVLAAGARRSAQQHGLPFEELTAAETRRRFPIFAVSAGDVGLFEPRAGVLFPELAIESALRLAEAAGAELHYEEPVSDWNPGEAITLRTRAGHWRVERLIVAAGAWMAGDLVRTRLPLRRTADPLLARFLGPRADRP
jgi:sarcosine oxidase